MWGHIYLLHFAQPIAVGHPTQHYVGWALDVQARLVEHRAGRGARLTQVAVARGIAFDVVRTWEGARALERQIKKRKYAPRICPVCSGEHAMRRCTFTAHQLQLPLEEEWPASPYTKMDSYEFLMIRRWRLSMPVPIVDVTRLDDLL